VLSFSTAVAYSFCDHAHCLVVFVLQSIDDIHAETLFVTRRLLQRVGGASSIVIIEATWYRYVPIINQPFDRERHPLSASLLLSSAWSLDGKVMYELESLQRVL